MSQGDALPPIPTGFALTVCPECRNWRYYFIVDKATHVGTICCTTCQRSSGTVYMEEGIN